MTLDLRRERRERRARGEFIRAIGWLLAIEGAIMVFAKGVLT